MSFVRKKNPPLYVQNFIFLAAVPPGLHFTALDYSVLVWLLCSALREWPNLNLRGAETERGPKAQEDSPSAPAADGWCVCLAGNLGPSGETRSSQHVLYQSYRAHTNSLTLASVHVCWVLTSNQPFLQRRRGINTLVDGRKIDKRVEERAFKLKLCAQSIK